MDSGLCQGRKKVARAEQRGGSKSKATEVKKTEIWGKGLTRVGFGKIIWVCRQENEEGRLLEVRGESYEQMYLLERALWDAVWGAMWEGGYWREKNQ